MVASRLPDLYAAVLAAPGITLAELAATTGLSEAQLSQDLASLEGLRLASCSPATQGYLAHSPSVALSTVVSPLEAQVEELQDQIARRRAEIAVMARVFRDVRLASDSSLGFEIISNPRQVSEVLQEAARRAQRRVLICQPLSEITDNSIDRSTTIDTELLGRGVARQTLLSTRTLEDRRTQHLVRTLSPLGAEFRTIDFLPTLFMIFDDDLAVIQRNDSPADVGAILLTDRSLVRIFSGFFSYLWEEGADFLGPGEAPNPLSPTQRSVLSAMAAGVADEAIARRLNISVRTCRRHIAKIMALLGAESRFQAGVRAANAGWLD